MTVETLSLAAGALLSLLFGYVPGFRTWFDGKDPITMRLIMLGCLVLIAVAVFGASCANLQIPGVNLVCSAQGAWGLFQVFALAAIANQTTYSLTSVSSAKVKAARAAKAAAK